MENKIRVEAGTKKIGEEINGKKITSLGKIWTQFISDDDACCFGLMPGRDYRIKFQYAYFD